MVTHICLPSAESEWSKDIADWFITMNHGFTVCTGYATGSDNFSDVQPVISNQAHATQNII